MRMRFTLLLILLAAIPVWAQTDNAAQDGDDTTTATTEMAAPPPVSGQAYPTLVGAETRTNYLSGGLAVSAAYIHNLYTGGSSALDETTISIEPDLALDQASPRQHRTIRYNPGFTFYQPTSDLNEVDQNLTGKYRIQLSPHVMLTADDELQRTSTAYSAVGAVSGSAPTSLSGAVPLLAQRLSNTANAVTSWQFGPTSMVGGSVQFTELHFPNPSEVTGLFDSNSQGGSAFYTRQLSEKQYTGVVYQYVDMLAYPPKTSTSETQTNTIYPFFTQYLTRKFSLSISGGPQHYATNASSVAPATAQWSPSVMASMGWQGLHTAFSASYSQAVTAGGGLLGAYHSDQGGVSARWQISKNWTSSLGGGYISNKGVNQAAALASPGGHMISGSFLVDHSISSHLVLHCEYDRTHESYAAIAALANAPDMDRVTVALAWRFTRPLGN